MNDTAVAVKPKRSLIGRLARLFMWLVVIVLVVGAIMIWLGTRKPEYWQVVDTSDPVVAERAERYFNSLHVEASRIRPPDEVYELTLTQAESNEWLATMLPKWLKNQQLDDNWPAQVTRPMIVFEPGRAVLAAQVDVAGLQGVVSASFAPLPADAGSDRTPMTLQSVKSGSLAMPVNTVLDLIKAGVTEKQAKDIDENRALLDKFTIPNLSLGDGREVEVLSVTLDNGAAVLRCRTVPKKKKLK